MPSYLEVAERIEATDRGTDLCKETGTGNLEK